MSHTDVFKSIIYNMPQGYAYHKILYNNAGEPEDYMVLQVNPVFENIIGLNNCNIIGKRVSEIFPGIKEEIDWVAINGESKSKEFTKFIKHLNCWYRVYVYSPERDFFVTLFSDVSEEKQLLEDKETLITSLNDIVLELDSNYTYKKIWTSDENLLIKPREYILNKRVDEVFDGELTKSLTNALNQAAATGKKVTIEYKLLMPGGSRCFQAKIHSRKNTLNEIRYFVIISNVTERKQAEYNLSKRLSYERLINRISSLAVNSEHIEVFQNESLRLMGETLNVSRIYIFVHNHKTDTMNNTFEWVAPGINTERENLQGIPSSAVPWWTKTMKDNRIINYKDIEDIPDEGTKRILRSQSIKSLLVVPLFLDHTYFGFLGFDECEEYREWPEEDVNLLLSISRLITQVLLRKSVEDQLQNERAQLLSLFDSINEPIYVTDMESYKILYANKVLQDTFGKKLVGEICYKALQRNNTPCEFCTNMIIKKLNYQPYYWEYHNPFVKKDYQVIDRMIRWPDGRDVRFEIAIDITKRKQTEEALFNEKERLRVTFHSIGDGVITTDKEGQIVMLNKVAEELTGWSQNEAIGKPFFKVFNIINEQTREQCENPVGKVLQTGKTVGLANDTALISKDGIERVIADSAAPIRDQAGNILGVVLVFRDITEEKKKNEEIIYLSYHDTLTGLYNRRFFDEELRRMGTERQLPISLIMGDVNGLKVINDVFGHQEGDCLLKTIARILKDSCRTEDLIARWGGDEFVIFLPQTSYITAGQICERIVRACKNIDEEKKYYSISLGYATKEKVTEDIMHVLKKAEDFMYKKKLLESKSLRSSIISSLKKSLFEKSHETEEHARRLSYYCKKIGLAFNLSNNELNELELLSMLHDIGKIAVKDSILTKPGKLTDKEWLEMKKHPEIGYRIAQSVPELSQVAEYILCHHERWDGKGYPQGMKAENIPFLSRILAVVDAYDAMTSDRPYRKALSSIDTKKELLEKAGTQFDPEIVRVFLEDILKK